MRAVGIKSPLVPSLVRRIDLDLGAMAICVSCSTKQLQAVYERAALARRHVRSAISKSHRPKTEGIANDAERRQRHGRGGDNWRQQDT